MDPERERIQADLRGLLEGEIRCDDLFLQLYASDASIYEVRPLGVVRPRHTADVAACLRYASENQIPVIARGAGTGLAGESLGRALVVDFSYSMRRIVDTGEDSVRVQPGVVHARLNAHLARRGHIFGPDPATSRVTTMGSVLAIDGSGSHWLKYGAARRHVKSLQVVLADGTITELGTHSISQAIAAGATSNSFATPDQRRLELVQQVAGLVQRHGDLIDKYQSKSPLNRSGYNLTDLVTDDQLHLSRLLVGSEGTLALITEATLHTDPLPQHRGVVLLMFDRLETAARAALEAVKLGAVACDLMDRRLLGLARETDVRFDLLIPAEAEAMLLVEHEGESTNEVRDKLAATLDRIRRRRKMAFDSHDTLDQEEVELYWQIARRVAPSLYRLQGSHRPLPFIEDMAVPPEELPGFLGTVQNVLKKHQATASLFAHAGQGQLHIRPLLDLALGDQVSKLHALAEDLYAEVLSVGGTISGEHGDGLSRTWYVRRQYGPLYDVFGQVKRIFDPENILNPDKIVAQDPPQPTEQLRPVLVAEALRSPPPEEAAAPPAAQDVPGTSATRPVELQLRWDLDQFAYAARSCNGCGRCRGELPDERMCPIFRLSPAEEASPRAKANLVRAILTGRLESKQLGGEGLKAISDLCVNCHQCRLECPAAVDIPKLVQECKAQHVADNGLRLPDKFLSSLDRISTWAGRLRPLANWALRHRASRWLLEKAFGIAQGRKLPQLAPRTFARWAQRRRLHRPTRRSGPKVLYFADIYANWYDSSLGRALVSVMEHNGVAVLVYPHLQNSAMAMITLGDVERAKEVAARNVLALAEAVRQGYTIVASEPSAVLALTHEYLKLLDDEDAHLVAENTQDACAFLWQMHQAGRLQLDFKPLSALIGYHLPCHLRALEIGTPGLHLMRLIPGLVVRHVERGCSGMAGIWGLKRENYRSSLRAGWGLISALRDPAIQVGATECSACKIQMEQGTTKPTIHPLKILALAYGLMPEFESLLKSRGSELVVT